MRITRPAPGARVPLESIDLYDPSLYATGDPHLAWQTLRDEAPVFRQELGDGRHFWSVTKHDDCRRVLSDYQSFTSQRGAILKMVGVDDPAGGRQMALTDPPRHAQLRLPLQQLLSVSALRPKEAQLRAAVKDLLSPLGRPEPWDLGAAVLGLPMLVSRMLLGLPADDLPELVRWGMMTVAPDDPEFQVGGPEATLHVAHQELFAYFANELDRRDGQVRDDLIGRLMTAVVDGARMRHGEIIANCYSILLGANVNTGHVITAALLELRDDHAQYAAWAEHPQRRRAIEEALRWASPVVHFMRYTTAEVTIRGVRIPKGDPVVAWIASANRDPEVFDRPFRFDIDRRPNQHIAFGDGAHYCIGAATARLTLQIAMEEILRQVESFDYIGAAEHLHSNFTGGIKHLRVVARPRRS